mmetsp:Transcript_100139/g.272217  ORF Transcript_100139/g.272217 Transcript_100139/m.272217 type:complete len:357 (+) Transcript_100139:505-1575(+)
MWRCVRTGSLKQHSIAAYPAPLHKTATLAAHLINRNTSNLRNGLLNQVLEKQVRHLVLHTLEVSPDVQPAGLIGADLLLEHGVEVEVLGQRPLEARGTALVLIGAGDCACAMLFWSTAKLDSLFEARAYGAPSLWQWCATFRGLLRAEAGEGRFPEAAPSPADSARLRLLNLLLGDLDQRVRQQLRETLRAPLADVIPLCRGAVRVVVLGRLLRRRGQTLALAHALHHGWQPLRGRPQRGLHRRGAVRGDAEEWERRVQEGTHLHFHAPDITGDVDQLRPQGRVAVVARVPRVGRLPQRAASRGHGAPSIGDLLAHLDQQRVQDVASDEVGGRPRGVHDGVRAASVGARDGAVPVW